MDIMNKLLSCNMDSITSSLCSILLWTAKLPSLLKIPNQPPLNNHKYNDLQVGLKTLIHSEPKQPPADPIHGLSTVHYYNFFITASKPSSPPLSVFRSSVMDDLIGTESGDSIMSTNEDDLRRDMDKFEPHINDRSRLRYRSTATREYPPPIPLLAQTNNLPCVFKREYNDGRLIVRAERVKHHENMEAHREKGRLVMKLVPVDDAVYCGNPMREDEEDVEREEVTEECCVNLEEEKLASEESCLEKESEPCGESPKNVIYAGWVVQDSNPFGKGNGIGGANGFFGRPDSAPLPPMTTVV